MVSHSMEDVAKVATKILVMNSGRLFCYDTPDEVFRRAKELEQIGLAVPQITRVFNRLKAEGISVPDNVYTVDRAEEVLLSMLKQGGEADD